MVDRSLPLVPRIRFHVLRNENRRKAVRMVARSPGFAGDHFPLLRLVRNRSESDACSRSYYVVFVFPQCHFGTGVRDIDKSPGNTKFDLVVVIKEIGQGMIIAALYVEAAETEPAHGKNVFCLC